MSPRFAVLALVFFVAVINYVDRQAFSVASPALQKEFHMPPGEFGLVVSAFLLAYALGQPLAGRFLDRIGSVRGFAWAVLFWSIACALHALASGTAAFGVYRFLLGFGEAALIPACIKTVSEWLPRNDQAYGIGIMNAGISIGGMIATPLVAQLTLRYGWRVMFIVTGLMGVVWLAVWLGFMRGRQPAPSHAQPQQRPSRQLLEWGELIKRRELLGLILSRIISDPAWYFYLFWLPPYLAQERGFDLRKLSYFGWIPLATAAFGALLSGWLARKLIASGWTVDRTRKSVLLLAALFMPAGVFVGSAPDPLVALALISLVTFLIQIWATSLFSIPADLYPPATVGSVAGFAAMTGSFSAMVFQFGVGQVIERFSYTPVFTSVALMHPVALVCIVIFIPRIARLKEDWDPGNDLSIPPPAVR